MPTGLRDNHQGRRCSSSAAHNKFDTKLKYFKKNYKDTHTHTDTQTGEHPHTLPPALFSSFK